MVLLLLLWIPLHFLSEGKPTNPVTGKQEAEKGMAMRVVTDLLRPFVDTNHVVYCDNYFSSGPLVEALAMLALLNRGH